MSLVLDEASVMENGNVYCGTIWGAEKRIHEEYKHQVEYYRSIPFETTYEHIIMGGLRPMETLLTVLLALQDGPMAGMRLSILPHGDPETNTALSNKASGCCFRLAWGCMLTISISTVLANLIICIKRVLSE